MKFEKALKLTSALVALSGLFALFITREAADWLVVPAALLIAATTFSTAASPVILKGRTVTVATVIAAALSVLDFFYISGSLILAGAHFLVILLCLKSLSLARDRDYIQLYGVSFFILLASTGLSTDIGFLWGFIFFFISLTWSLMLLTVKSEAERAGKTAAGWKAGRLFFIATALLTLASTVFTLAIFMAIPRIGIGYFSKHTGGLLKSAGFSDRVELGSMGEVLLDPTAVMRVELSGAKPPRELYWRGRSFDRYNGKSWGDSLNRRVMLETDYGPFYLGLGKKPPKEPVVQRISLEPTDSATLFVINPAFEISINSKNLVIDQSRAIFLPSPPPGRIDYTVSSAPVEPSAHDLERQPPVMPQDAERYLQLPEGSGEIASLAKRITAGEDNRYLKTRRVMGYLNENYSYSLDPPRDERFAPVNDFLFHSKSGYCGHFATSMALLLRAAGVPSRLVSGFMGGDFNELGHYFIVRERDAHTWVEVYFPEYGWVTFDPTPESRSNLSRPAAGFSKFIDLIKFKWDRYIVFYSLHDQIGTARSVSTRLSKAKDDALQALRWLAATKKANTLPSQLPVMGVVLLSAILLTAAAFYLISRRPGKRGHAADVWFYKKMNDILARKGIKRPPSVTPVEFALRLSAERKGVFEGVLYITNTYNKARFGGHMVKEDELSALREALELLKRE